ncbi:MAG: hypothetical protein KBC27_00280 [Rickettsiales bacterium]|nr:hypothetical protein [Rickettsiales bacterium]
MKFIIKTFITVYIGLLVSNLSSAVCHPEIDLQKKQYIIGYGSLISEKSKRFTTPGVSNNFPVEITGFRRGWFHVIGTEIFLGTVEDPKNGLNAVIFSLDKPEQVKAFDEREINYCRKNVPESKIKTLTQDKIDGEVWIYVTKSPEYLYGDDRGASIHASYLYTFLSGCLDIQKHFNLDSFLANCMTFTYGAIPQITYDVDRDDKIRKGRVIPIDSDMKVINNHICSDRKLLSYLKKDLFLYKKICE